MMRGRPKKYGEEFLGKLAKRFPWESNRNLVEELQLPLHTIKFLASKNGWRKGQPANVMERDIPLEIHDDPEMLVEQMRSRGAQRRNIGSGVLWSLPGTIVHVPK